MAKKRTNWKVKRAKPDQLVSMRRKGENRVKSDSGRMSAPLWTNDVGQEVRRNHE